MKKLICLWLFTAMISTAFCQHIDSSAVSKLPPVQQEKVYQYLQQAKDARSVGYVLSVLGAAATFGGAAMFVHALEQDQWFDDKEPNVAPGIVVTLAGVGMGLVAIRQFRKSQQLLKRVNGMVFAGGPVKLAPAIVLPGTASLNVGIAITLGK